MSIFIRLATDGLCFGSIFGHLQHWYWTNMPASGHTVSPTYFLILKLFFCDNNVSALPAKRPKWKINIWSVSSIFVKKPILFGTHFQLFMLRAFLLVYYVSALWRNAIDHLWKKLEKAFCAGKPEPVQQHCGRYATIKHWSIHHRALRSILHHSAQWSIHHRALWSIHHRALWSVHNSALWLKLHHIALWLIPHRALWSIHHRALRSIHLHSALYNGRNHRAMYNRRNFFITLSPHFRCFL